MTGCCDSRKGKAVRLPQICHTIRWYHPEKMSSLCSFQRLWTEGYGGKHLVLVLRSNMLLLAAYEDPDSDVCVMKRIAKQENWQLNVCNVLPVLAEISSTARWSRSWQRSLYPWRGFLCPNKSNCKLDMTTLGSLCRPWWAASESDLLYPYIQKEHLR